MRTIYKYELEVTDQQIVSVHFHCLPLKVGVENDKPVIWYIIDTENRPIDRIIRIVGTGHDISDLRSRMTGIGNFNDWSYLGAFQLSTGFVGHVFTDFI